MDNWDGDDRRQRDVRWHLDKRVNVGHMLTTLALAVALFTWASGMERRDAIVEERLQAQRERLEQFDKSRQNELTMLRGELEGIRGQLAETNRKLDRLVEAGRRP